MAFYHVIRGRSCECVGDMEKESVGLCELYQLESVASAIILARSAFSSTST